MSSTMGTPMPPVYRASCPDAADGCTLLGVFRESLAKTCQCDGGSAPHDYVSLPGSGTSQTEIDKLYQWEAHPSRFGERFWELTGCFRDSLTDEQKNAIVESCRNIVGLAQLLCAAQGVIDALKNGGNVCRHYAWALDSVLADLEIESFIECGFKNMAGHAWVEAIYGERRYLLDAYNQSYVCADPIP
jgi:hypothetical protein